jgi:hypothetical protein
VQRKARQTFVESTLPNCGLYCHSAQHLVRKVPEAALRTNFKVVVGGQEKNLSNWVAIARVALIGGCYWNRRPPASTSDSGYHSGCPIGCWYPIISLNSKLSMIIIIKDNAKLVII